MSRGTVLLTGATGFVGGAIALELLERTNKNLVCLVRSSGGVSASDRLQKSLLAGARAYDITLSDSDLSRCRAVEGDITMPDGGVTPGDLPEITEFWHVAGSLAFEDHRAAEISLHNEQGTKNVIELARKSDCVVFNYVSTAYVAGDRQGVIAETALSESTRPNNHYERSKMAAESMVHRAGFDTARIFRPSIVIGHGKTYGATNFSGFYGFIRGVLRVHDMIGVSLGELLKYRPLRLLADGSVPVNLIPIDVVARAAVRIAVETDVSNIYHLANSTPPKLADCWGGATTELGMMRPLFVTSPDEFTLIDQKVDEEMDFYRPYLNSEKWFDVSNAGATLGDGALACPLSADDVAKYAHSYLTYRESVKSHSVSSGRSDSASRSRS